MPVRKDLELAREKPNDSELFISAKSRLIENLEIQLKCAEAMVRRETYMRSKMVTVEVNGVKVDKPISQPIHHWYWRDSEGNVRFGLRVLNKRMEIEEGKPDIVVGKDVDLPNTIKSVIEAVSAGELDSLIKRQVGTRKKNR